MKGFFFISQSWKQKAKPNITSLFMKFKLASNWAAWSCRSNKSAESSPKAP